MPQPRSHPLLARIVGAVVALAGLALAAGGAWLISLGGSAYYLVAGLAMAASGALLVLRRTLALWLYAALVIGTLAWALAEIGLDWWAMIPRGDLVFVLGALMLLPWVTRALPEPRRGVLALGASLLLAAVVGVVAMAGDEHELTGALPPALRAAPVNYGHVPDDEWRAWGRSDRGERWSPLRQITTANVDRLQVAWRFDTGDPAGPDDPKETTYELTPLEVGGRVFLCTPHAEAIALDAETGRELWRFRSGMKVSKDLQHLTCRGVSYWAATDGAGECPERIFLSSDDGRLFALDARTGRLCPGFGEAGVINLWRGMPKYQEGFYEPTSPALVAGGLVIVGGSVSDNVRVDEPSGVVRAFDVRTGRLVWNFDPGRPDATQPIGANERYTLSSPNVWTVMSADEDLGLVYLPTGNQPPDQWGGARPATTERFSSSIVALDLATGRVRWVYQTVHHDLWDMDVGSQPSLLDLTQGSQTIPALVAPTKTGNLFVLDRRTGQPVFAAPERRVPGGAAAGDHASPTQPFSAVSFMPHRVREADAWGVTPFDQLACRIQFRRLRYEGPFTPPSTRGTLVFPGNFGVFDWGGVAVDPQRQIVFANPDYMAFVDKLIPRPNTGGKRPSAQEPASGSDVQGSANEAGYNPNYGAPFAVALNAFLSPLKLPCQAPPWGYVAALDLRTGRTAWMHRNGTVRDESPVPLPLKMGVPALGGPILTAGGVAFLTSTLDYYVRAYDVATGRELWRDRLPAGGQATPMSYRSPTSHRQFVVVVAGGHGSLGTKQGDHVIAYALPRG
jgi:quinoprotein glucose dehydrogenase